MSAFPPTLLRSGDLTLRPPAEDDVPAVRRLFCDTPDVLRYVGWKPKRTDEEAAYFLEILRAGWDEDRPFWFVEAPGELLPVGSIVAARDDGDVEISYVVAEDAWGRGIATRVVQAVAEAALSDPSVTRVRAYCDAENHASARVLEKSGFARDALLPRHGRHNVSPELRDCLRYIRTRTSRPAAHPPPSE